MYVHHPSFEPVAYLEAILKQISAALPFSYFLFDPHGQFRDLPRGLRLLSWLLRQPSFWLALGMAAPVLWLLSKAVRRAAAIRPRSWLLTLSVGLLLIVLPTVLVAASPFHRDQLGWGSGWVSILIQVHGTALVLTTAVWQFLASGWWEQRPVAKRFSAAGLITAGIVFTQVANVNFVPKFNHHRCCLAGIRANVEEALARGLLQDVPDQSPVLLTNEYPGWFGSEKLYAGLTTAGLFFAARVPQWLKLVSVRLAPPELTRSPHYRLTDVCLDDTKGYVLLERWGGASNPVRLEEVRVYIHMRELFHEGSGPASFQLVERVPTLDGAGAADHVLRHAGQFRQVRSGRDWGIFSISAVDCLADAGRLRIVLDDRELAALRRIKPSLETAGAAVSP
jgi:hypothetical protein